MTTKEIQYAMFSDYLDELQNMLGWKMAEDWKKRALFRKIQEYEFSKWVNIRVGRDIVGFFIIGWNENCHPSADYYIEEAYIKPGYRRKGYMSYAISEYIKQHQGVYCLLILNKNEVGYKFWHTMFDRIGYVPCELSDVGAADEDCKQYGFVPKEKVGV